MEIRFKKTKYLILTTALIFLIIVSIAPAQGLLIASNSDNIEPDELTAGIKYQSLNISLDEEIDEAMISITLGDMELYNITEEEIDDSEFSINPEEKNGFIFNETGQYNVTINWNDNTTETKFHVHPPEIEFTINAQSDISIATSGIDREYQINVSVKDFNEAPIENGNLWLISSDEDGLNESFVDEWNSSMDREGFSLDENGDMSFNFTPSEPIEIFWRIGCEETGFNESTVVEEPLLKAEDPYIEVFSPILNETIDKGHGDLSMELPFGSTHELKLLLKQADEDDDQLQNEFKIDFNGPFKECNVSSTTKYDENSSGQVGWLSFTPTGTGLEIIEINLDEDKIGAIDIYKGDYGDLKIDGPDEVAVGEKAVYNVTIYDEPIEGVNVTAGDKTLETDENGEVVFTYNSSGTVYIWAEKEENTSNYYSSWMETEVNYTYVEKNLDVTIETDQGYKVVDREIELKVTHEGEPVENATVIVDGNNKYTDSDGVTTVSFDEAGEHEVIVKNDGYKTENEIIEYGTEKITINVGETPGINLTLILTIIIGASLLLTKLRDVTE
ncbi:carboxypeptidase-like regulatory domain-containing protein [Methanonatronarchaeum sp. AMET-Sl]|uniref:carboxypeptidase-like regulatory domain-containing protein n=1 Tax=Methanonatronarchaeum sp. AMET-Sl TaxID=3037654 RepID=UPI00244DEB0B|nr:carboxypeptidase-like regulatory domain-containing protein [Methanonatronarchaeum sp. AMET-Sl]WGI17337.1 carboxypeptidase-like regulatory domain-containing protein [Methanonatronarchaeum sp. AMET-Sl]